MSLFPSFNSNDDNQIRNFDADESWLKSSSFDPTLVLPQNVEQSKSGKDGGGVYKTDYDDDVEVSKVEDARADSPLTVLWESEKEKTAKKSKHSKHKKSKQTHSERKEAEHKKKHKHDHKYRSRSRNRSPVKQVPRPRKIFLEEMRDLGYEDAYRLDRKPDKDNYAFQSLNKKHLSRYKNFFKMPFGIRRSEKLSWLKADSSKAKPTRYYSKGTRRDVYQFGEALQPNTELLLSDRITAVIELPPKHKEQPERSESNPHGILDSGTALWSVGKAPEACATPNASKDGYLQYLNSAVAQNIVALNKELRESPSNISLWLELLNIQEGLLQHRTDDDSARLFTEQNILEKKMAILEQAMTKNPSNLQLKLKHLELSSHNMESAEMNVEWKKLTFTHINDIQVWRGYLTQVKSSFEKFTVGVMVKAYTKCIRSLRQVSSGMVKSHPCQTDTEKHMIDILMELCDLLHLANHTEKAVALIQAMLEFNINRPDGLDSHEQALDSFQLFHDSGVPRFGEPGAKGWCNYKSSEEQQGVRPAPLKPTVAQDEDEEARLLTAHQTSSRVDVWLALESSRQLSHWLPWRPAAGETDEDCEDPHRLILSDDIIDLLFYIQDSKLRTMWYFTVLEWFGLKMPNSSTRYTTGTLSGVNQLSGVPAMISQHCQTTEWHQYLLCDLFISHLTEQLFAKLSGADKSRLVQVKFLQQLQQIQRFTDKKEKKRKSKEFKSYAKSILSLPENRSNESLWLCYAYCNRELGSYTDVRQVLDALIDSNSSHTNSASSINRLSLRCDIWWQVVQLEMLRDNPDKLLECSWWFFYGVVLQPSASQKLLLVQKAESQLNQLSQQQSGGAEQYARVFTHVLLCYCLVQVLVNGCAALEQAVSYWLSVIESDSAADIYDIYTKLAKVLKYTCTHLYQSNTPLLRSVLQKALSDYPECSSLLTSYLDVEQQGHVTTRVRQFFTSNLQSNLSRIGCDQLTNLTDRKERLAIQSVLFEFEKLQAIDGQSESGERINRGINNRIRSLCEKCLSNVCPKSIILWRLYLYHEKLYGSAERLESAFFSALQSCPYAKVIYEDAISYIPDKYEKFLDIADAKEIRIHTPSEELDILLHQG